jgi:ferredoxin-thioredoxin reductase catalytic subunit
MKVLKNPHEEALREIVEAVKANDGYCPCEIEKTEDTKCPCKKFRDSEDADFCHCGRFYKIPDYEVLAVIGDTTDGEEEIEGWEHILLQQNFIVLPIKFDANNLFHHSNTYMNISKVTVAKADALLVLDTENDLVNDVVQWAEMIDKKILHRRDIIA